MCFCLCPFYHFADIEPQTFFSLFFVEQAMRESFAMQRERVAVAVERQRELDEMYNPHHHLLNACTIDDLALVQYLVQEEGCDIEVTSPPILPCPLSPFSFPLLTKKKQPKTHTKFFCLKTHNNNSTFFQRRKQVFRGGQK